MVAAGNILWLFLAPVISVENRHSRVLIDDANNFVKTLHFELYIREYMQ